MSLEALSNDDLMSLSNVIQSRNCRTHNQGSFQSSSMTKRVSGIDGGVKSGLSKGAKEDSGSERR